MSPFRRLQSRYIGRLPEGKKQSLKQQIRQELDHLLSQNPDLKLVVTADGAKDNWTFSKSLNPDVEALDFWHALMPLLGPMKRPPNGLRASAIFFATIPRVSAK